MAETLTLTRLGITGPLTRALASTNSIESMIECVRRTNRNVKRRQSGEMALRWTAAGMLEAERQFRRIIGYQQLAKLAMAIERDVAPPMTTKEVVSSTRQRNTSVLMSQSRGLGWHEHDGCTQPRSAGSCGSAGRPENRLSDIARALDRAPGTIHNTLRARGGVWPP